MRLPAKPLPITTKSNSESADVVIGADCGVADGQEFFIIKPPG